ncbi:Hsp20/alpha crystallin family protein [Paracoccus rhizosphaerae]
MWVLSEQIMEEQMSVTDLIPRNWIWWRKENNPAPAQTREDNLDPFLNFQREVNHLFDDFFRSVPTRLPFSGGGFGTGFPSLPLSGAIWPKVEIAETSSEIRVSAEIPGLSERDVELLLEDERLVIRGERSQHVEDKDRQFSERFYGRFERHIPLPAGVEKDKAEARFDNGVLYIILPKAAQAPDHVKRIEIRH